MIRKAYFEDPAYVPLVSRAFDLWRGLETRSGEQLLRTTGVLSVGREESEIISGTQSAAAQHNLALERLSQKQVQSRYPALRLERDEVALFEPDAGVLHPERAVAAYLEMAREAGAQLQFGRTMQRWQARNGSIDIQLDNGDTITAGTLVLSLGPWFRQTLESLGVPIEVQRNVQAWFTPARRGYESGGFPAFLLDRAGLVAPLYGFPDFGDGVKAAFHGAGQISEAHNLDRRIDFATDVGPIVEAMEKWMPGAAGTFRDATPCMYTNTPDGYFIVDRHPDHPNVILCGGFCGHGFKFAPVIGEIGADLAAGNNSRYDIGFLSLSRFARR